MKTRLSYAGGVRRVTPVLPATAGEWVVETDPGIWIAPPGKSMLGEARALQDARRYPSEESARQALRQVRRAWSMPLRWASVYRVTFVKAEAQA